MDFLSMRASWQMIGVCVETRKLSSPSNKSWEGWVAKVETFGGTYDITLTEAQFKVMGEGVLYKCVGSFEERVTKTGSKTMNFIARTIDEIDPKAGKAS